MWSVKGKWKIYHSFPERRNLQHENEVRKHLISWLLRCVIPSSRIMHAAKKFKWEIIDHNIICSLLLDYLDCFDYVYDSCKPWSHGFFYSAFHRHYMDKKWVLMSVIVLAFCSCWEFKMSNFIIKLLKTNQWLVEMDF